MRLFLFVALFITGCLTVMPETNEPPKKSPADLMAEMRLKQLTMSPAEAGQKPTREFPQVCAVIMDWPIDAATVSVIARNTGDASIYTTGTFGVIGGIGHEKVNSAAKACVTVADRHFKAATPTKEYPLPKAGHIRFYLVGYDGVRVIDTDLKAVEAGKDGCSDLFVAAQRVLTELRSIAQEGKSEK